MSPSRRGSDARPNGAPDGHAADTPNGGRGAAKARPKKVAASAVEEAVADDGLPAVGEFAPDLELLTDANVPITLASLRGRRVVLFFYPKDDTSGCTAEACEFRDLLPRITAGDAVVIGVSPDSVRSHAKFKAKYALPYTLLADTEHRLAEAYGVWKEKSMYGRKYMGVERTTVLIDPDGRVARVWRKVKPEGHAAEVEAALAGRTSEPA